MMKELTNSRTFLTSLLRYQLYHIGENSVKGKVPSFFLPPVTSILYHIVLVGVKRKVQFFFKFCNFF